MNVSTAIDFWLVKFFHSFPHINITFQLTNSTFDVGKTSYLESLGFLAALPVLWLCFTLIFFIIFYCCVACKKSTKKKNKPLCLQILMTFLTLMMCGAIGIGIYGNERTSYAVGTFVNSVDDTDKTIQSSLKTIESLENIVVNVTGVCRNVIVVLDEFLPNVTARQEAIGYINDVIAQANGVQGAIASLETEANNINLDFVSADVTHYEGYRWLGSLVMFCTLIFVAFLLLLGILKKSKCLLVWCCGAGMLMLILSYASGGVYLASSMAAGDFCTDPDSYIELQVKDPVERNIIDAYIRCKDPKQPFWDDVVKATNDVTEATTKLELLVNMSLPYNISQNAMSNISTLVMVATCTHIHENYVTAIDAGCVQALTGFAYMALMFIIIGFVMSFLMCLAPRTWYNFGTRRGYFRVDDTDPFLPGPPPYSGYGSMSGELGSSRHERVSILSSTHGSTHGSVHGSIHGSTHGSMHEGSVHSLSRVNDSVDIMTIPGRVTESPPPAYRSRTDLERYNVLGTTTENTET